MRVLTFCLLLTFVGAPTGGPQSAKDKNGAPVHNIQLSETHDIADATAVSNAIDRLVEDAQSASCSAAKDARSCACGFRNHVATLQKAFDVAVGKHPAWNAENTVVAYDNPAKHTSVVIDLAAIQRQLDACQRQSQ